MQFVAICPQQRSIETIEALNLRDALRMAWLDPGAVDHGMLSLRVGYVVYEFALFTPPAEQHYFSIGKALMAGNAVLYGVGEAGETVNLMASAVPTPRFYLGQNDVENAIQCGEVIRPVIAVNGERIWAWPQPAPPEFRR